MKYSEVTKTLTVTVKQRVWDNFDMIEINLRQNSGVYTN